MSAGGALEAAYLLQGPLKVGSWHVVGDGVILYSCDVTFDLVWRKGAGEQTLASVTHHFDPPASGFNATSFEQDVAGVAAAVKSGDSLVLRISAQGMSGQLLYIPNGDGNNARGRIPSVTLPK